MQQQQQQQKELSWGKDYYHNIRGREYVSVCVYIQFDSLFINIFFCILMINSSLLFWYIHKLSLYFCSLIKKKVLSDLKKEKRVQLTIIKKNNQTTWINSK